MLSIDDDARVARPLPSYVTATRCPEMRNRTGLLLPGREQPQLPLLRCGLPPFMLAAVPLMVSVLLFMLAVLLAVVCGYLWSPL